MPSKKIQVSPLSQDEKSANNNSPQIMIIDDSPEILKLLKDILDYHGYLIRPFSSGGPALKSMMGEVPDLILLDIKMPVMDGYEVCNHIKSNEKTSKVPVIFISGQDDAADKVKGFNAGGVDYITKPFHLAEVMARIETHLSLCRLQKQLEGQNIHLQKEIAERKKAEEELLKHKNNLQVLIAQRTAELSKTNAELQLEIAERKHLEEALETANYKLHSLVYEYGLRNRRIAIFNKMSEQLQACLSREEAYPIINYFVQKLFPAKAGAIFIFDHKDNFFKTATAWKTTLLGEKKFTSEDCLSIQKRKMHLSLDSQRESCCRHLCRTEGRSSICLPLLAQGNIFGILHLQIRTPSKLSRPKPSLDEASTDISIDIQQLAVTMADFFSLALVNIQLRETLKQQATRDPLTGLFNRRYMEDTLSREISRASRQGTPMGIIMLDLDHFRRFNNIFGHEAGDLALQEVGKFLQNNIRKEDIACRYGGEEFTLILPGASLEITKKRAEMLRHNVQNLQINYKGKTLDSVSFSLGVAIYPDHGQTQDAVIRAADEALYRAKHAGRKRVRLANNAKPAAGESKSLYPAS